MVSISRRYTEAAARLKRLEAQVQQEITRPSFACAPQFCAACSKDVPVEITTRGGVVVAVVCTVCHANLMPAKESTK